MRKNYSYALRRRLFKDIWNTGLEIDEIKAKKPRVINRIARLYSNQSMEDKKEERHQKLLKLKHLKTTCKKILNLCDREEADVLYNNKRMFNTKRRVRSPNRRKRHTLEKIHEKEKVSKNTSPVRIKNIQNPENHPSKIKRYIQNITNIPMNSSLKKQGKGEDVLNSPVILIKGKPNVTPKNHGRDGFFRTTSPMRTIKAIENVSTNQGRAISKSNSPAKGFQNMRKNLGREEYKTNSPVRIVKRIQNTAGNK